MRLSPLVVSCLLSLPGLGGTPAPGLLSTAGLAGARPAAPAAVEGDVDETLKEVIFSLDASYVEKVPLDRYALFALDALADLDRCLSRKAGPGSLILSCKEASFTVAWPPKKPLDVAQLLSNAARLVDPARQVEPGRVQRLARALAMAVDDPFTAYLSPGMMATALSQKHGMSAATPGIDLWPRDPTKVREVRAGSDAHTKGIVPGDRIFSIDGRDVATMTFPEVLQQMNGPNASEAKLQIKKAGGGGTREVAVARLLVPEDDVRVARLGAVLYVHIPVFKSGVAEAVRQNLQAGSYVGVILDLRHNPGGLLPEGVAVLDTFLREGLMAGVRSGPGRPTDDFVAHKDGFDTTMPLVVLIDGGSASASELTAMVLKDRGRATLIGATSAGKGSVQRQIPVPDGGLLKVTAGYYVGPTGKRLDEGGVRPHRFLAPSSRRTVLEGANPLEDSWVLSGLDVLQAVERNAVLYPGTGPTP
ncbi:MAG: S41 family peptidase [Deltaproteobacteria bacterium]|nr:S41 family peptidase [Deltaproteobacteria bacterium]